METRKPHLLFRLKIKIPCYKKVFSSLAILLFLLPSTQSCRERMRRRERTAQPRNGLGGQKKTLQASSGGLFLLLLLATMNIVPDSSSLFCCSPHNLASTGRVFSKKALWFTLSLKRGGNISKASKLCFFGMVVPPWFNEVQWWRCPFAVAGKGRHVFVISGMIFFLREEKTRHFFTSFPFFDTFLSTLSAILPPFAQGRESGPRKPPFFPGIPRTVNFKASLPLLLIGGLPPFFVPPAKVSSYLLLVHGN